MTAADLADRTDLADRMTAADPADLATGTGVC